MIAPANEPTVTVRPLLKVIDLEARDRLMKKTKAAGLQVIGPQAGGLNMMAASQHLRHLGGTMENVLSDGIRPTRWI